MSAGVWWLYLVGVLVYIGLHVLLHALKDEVDDMLPVLGNVSTNWHVSVRWVLVLRLHFCVQRPFSVLVFQGACPSYELEIFFMLVCHLSFISQCYYINFTTFYYLINFFLFIFRLIVCQNDVKILYACNSFRQEMK